MSSKQNILDTICKGIYAGFSFFERGDMILDYCPKLFLMTPADAYQKKIIAASGLCMPVWSSHQLFYEWLEVEGSTASS
ncbi:hypothetical protein J6590_019325, partial [Homalodisca vitripennis]